MRRRLLAVALFPVVVVANYLMRTMPDPAFRVTTEADDAEDREYADEVAACADWADWESFEAFQNERWEVSPDA